MAGESWKSHRNTSLERDMSADHDAQMDQWLDEQLGPGPAEVARSNAEDLARWQQGLGYPDEVSASHQLAQEILDEGYGPPPLHTDPDWDNTPEYAAEWAAVMARMEAAEVQEQAEITDQIAADWARNTARSIDPNGPVQVDSVEWLQARVDALRRKIPGDGSVQVYVPPPPDPQYRADADYPSVVVANTRVVPAETPQPDADTARFQTQLAIAQQVAAQQVQAQRQADAEAADRQASAALGHHIAPTSAAPARSPHR
jgi:hypothetical protein